VLDGMVIVEGEWAVFGCMHSVRPIVTNGDSDALFPNYFGEDLFSSSVGRVLRRRTAYLEVRSPLWHRRGGT